MKRFADLSEQEVLALAISNEEEDSRIYRDFAEGLRASFPDTAKMFDEMAAEEVHHRGMLYDLYRTKFGEHMPLVRRQDVRGFIRHKPVWLVRPLGLDEVRKYAAAMEYETARFYRKAAESARDASVRELLVQALRGRGQAPGPRRKSRRTPAPQGCPRPRGRDGATHVRAAIRATRPRRPDGRLGVDAGAAVCRRVCDPQHLGRPSWSGSRPRSAPGFPWPLPRPCPTTAR